MKQGSTDDPFAEDSDEDEPDSDSEVGRSTQDPPASESPVNAQGAATPATEPDDDDEPAAKSFSQTLPYIYKRDAVKEHRSQRPVYLRDYNEARIPELKDAVEGDLGEEVTKTDVLEAAMETALDHPELVAATLRTERYGYDWE
ncbi:hypothetical protein [Halorientalis marina]|uniref:hypothetical protein n=1 Tax=Halorientalis marina TaxID=2931976 RepID=UPI001FF19A60|nr:hypothetical protein [Halorientalis marina]